MRISKHRCRTAEDQDNGNSKKYFLLSKEINCLTFFCRSVEFRITYTNCIKCIYNQSGYNQCCKHGDHDTKGKCISKSLNSTWTKPHQHKGCDQCCNISIKDCRESFAETGLNRIPYWNSCTNFLSDSGINNNIGIHRHTDTKNNTRNTRKSKSNIKGIQRDQH